MRGSAILLAVALLCVAGTNAQFFVNLDKKKGTGSEVGAKADAAVGEAGDAGGLTDQAAALQVRAFRAAMDSLSLKAPGQLLHHVAFGHSMRNPFPEVQRGSRMRFARPTRHEWLGRARGNLARAGNLLAAPHSPNVMQEDWTAFVKWFRSNGGIISSKLTVKVRLLCV